jgi:hypothetical protein
LGQGLTLFSSGDFCREQMALDPPDEDVARVVLIENLVMRKEAVTIHFHVQAASQTLWANFHLSALDSCSYWKNRVVRDQSLSLLVYEGLFRFFIKTYCVQGLGSAR